MTLPAPIFIDTDAATVEREIVQAYEATTGKTLQPAQPDRLLLQVCAYRELALRLMIQEAAEQNLIAFARYPMLDYLAQLYGITRLGAVPAETTLRFTLNGVQPTVAVIPAGTRVRSSDGRVTFATAAQLTIPAGQLTGDMRALADPAGTGGNGYIAGEVRDLLDPIAIVSGAVSTAMTFGGADQESDERLRARTKLAPSSLTTAGPKNGYRYHAMAASGAVADVAVQSPVAGEVRVYVLALSGLPSAGLLAEVLAAVSDESVRPLTDTVTVAAPTAVPFSIEATIHIRLGNDPDVVMAAAQAAAEAYVADRQSRLGQDIVPSQVTTALSVPGVYWVELAEPAALLGVAASEWAESTGITLTQGDVVDG